jgi:hypothetical protein
VRALANSWNVSEYILYGRFVTEILGASNGHHCTSSSLCRDYWGAEKLSQHQIENLLDSMSPEEVGISLTAKAGIPAESYAALLEKRWRFNERGT